MPSFVIGEFYFLFLAVVTLVHALSHGRTHMFVWVASLCAGTANDAFFMVLPIVDNFWQAQACVMLTPRMPLYIPCVYVVFMYSSTVACWRLGLPFWASVCLTGLMGEMIYAPYDITGIKFLWWTWHDTDAPIRHRLLGVPIGSTPFLCLPPLFLLTLPSSRCFLGLLDVFLSVQLLQEVVGVLGRFSRLFVFGHTNDVHASVALFDQVFVSHRSRDEPG